MENPTQLIHALNNLVLQGRTMEAFEQFYDDEVIMQENDHAPTVGKEANRKREEQFMQDLVDFRGAKVLHVTSGENVTMVEWAYDYTHKSWGDRKYTQVSVQHWKNGKIVKEQFFYGG